MGTSFWRFHGYLPREIYLGKLGSHSLNAFSLGERVISPKRKTCYILGPRCHHLETDAQWNPGWVIKLNMERTFQIFNTVTLKFCSSCYFAKNTKFRVGHRVGHGRLVQVLYTPVLKRLRGFQVEKPNLAAPCFYLQCQLDYYQDKKAV